MNQGWLSLRFTTYLPTLPAGRQARLRYAVGYGTQNALKIVINFYFWYIGCNLGGDDEEFI